MKRITLSQGEFAIVDAKNYEWLSQWKWCAAWCENTQSFYAISDGKLKSGKRYTMSMAREILGLQYGDKRQADHINHDTLDNRESNLRIVTSQQNSWNRRNVRGYYWNRRLRKYRVQIRINGTLLDLGLFAKAEEARNAYLKAKKKYHKI